jgi:carbon storage regulator CsrA
MLILGRKLGEKIVIETNGETIEIVVTRIDHKMIKIGVKASDNVRIMRAELLDNTQKKGINELPR